MHTAENSQKKAPSGSEIVLLRVKRRRQDDDLDQIYLEYDADGQFKRTKLVTEKDSIQQAMSMVNLDSSGCGDKNGPDKNQGLFDNIP